MIIYPEEQNTIVLIQANAFTQETSCFVFVFKNKKSYWMLANTS